MVQQPELIYDVTGAKTVMDKEGKPQTFYETAISEIPDWAYPELSVIKPDGTIAELEASAVCDISNPEMQLALSLVGPPGLGGADFIFANPLWYLGFGAYKGPQLASYKADKWAQEKYVNAMNEAGAMFKAIVDNVNAAKEAKEKKGKGDIKEILTDYAKALKINMEVTSELGAYLGRENLRGNT